ncbi:hypothetical protein SFB93_14285 [Kurthia gibsonii]|uniref:hypothetical protein n=1 Tax=Kurthia gibsonii TaxID=33946 RepID=UPI003983A872
MDSHSIKDLLDLPALNICSIDANIFSKNTNDNLSKNNSEIEEHILVIEEYIIEKEKYTDQNKLSFAEYIKITTLKFQK